MIDGKHAATLSESRQAITAGMAGALERLDESVEENHRAILTSQIHERRTMGEADALQTLGRGATDQLPRI
ncbi:hypothetical protein D9M70_477050 [compost metagenome]